MIASKEKTKAVIFIADGFEEIEAVTVVDILRRAEIAVEVISVMGRKDVSGAHGINIVCDSVFEQAGRSIDEADMLILPGGGEGTNNLMSHSELGKTLVSSNEKGKHIAAICAAPSVLGRLGILAGKSAVCFPGFENKLTGASVSSDSVVLSENIITSKGAGTASVFALKIVEVLISGTGLDGRKVADKLKGQMFY